MKQLLQGKNYDPIFCLRKVLPKSDNDCNNYLKHRKLQPAFVPERRTEKRKTEPVFHEESPSKEAKKVQLTYM